MSIQTRIHHAIIAGTAHADTVTNPNRYTSRSDTDAAQRLAMWQDRLTEATAMATRQGTNRAIGHVHAVATEVELARRTVQARTAR